MGVFDWANWLGGLALALVALDTNVSLKGSGARLPRREVIVSFKSETKIRILSQKRNNYSQCPDDGHFDLN